MEPILTEVCEDLVVGKNMDKSPLVDMMKARNGNVTNGQSPLLSHSDTPIVGIITDFNLTAPIRIAHLHGIPGYMFSAFSADLLRQMLAVNESSIISESSVDDSGHVRQIDPSTNLPVITKETRDFILRINAAVPLTSGFLVNSFREFDPEVVDELEKSLNDVHVPLKFVGPLLAVTQTDFSPATRTLVQWLDEQPLRSVVYVSFGSMVILSDEQVMEIARALIASGSPAIWSLRQQQHNLLAPEIKTSVDELSHRGCGIIVLPWVPQRTVLAHPATGAMITHCGWNGTLESIFYGVPTLAWPIMDDQPINAECAVRNSLSVQVPTGHLRNPGSIISSADIQEHLKQLQRENYLAAAKHWSEVSRMAISSGGSSYQEFHNTFVLDNLENMKTQNLDS